MQNIAILEPITAGVQLVYEAKKMDLNPILLHNDKRAYYEADFAKLAQEFTVLPLDFGDEDWTESLKSWNEQYAFAAILPGTDFFIPHAQKAASLLGLKAFSEFTSDNVRNKFALRDTLSRNNIPNVKYAHVKKVADLERVSKKIGYPCVVKPVDGSGSLSVQKVENAVELKNAVQEIFAFKEFEFGLDIGSSALVEQFIEGPEFSVEGYVEDGVIEIVSITEKLLGPAPYFMESGHVVGIDLASEQKENINNYVESVVKAIEIPFGPFHAELRLQHGINPILIEIAGRLAGDRITDLIKFGLGINLYQQMVNSYLEKPVKRKTFRCTQKSSGIVYFYKEGINQYSNLEGFENLESIEGFLEKNIHIEPGETIGRLSDWRGRVASAIFEAPDYKSLTARMAQARNQVQVLS